MPDLTLLHTAQAHCDTFDALRDRIAPKVRLTHIVRPDLLARAQDGIDCSLHGEITRLITEIKAPVLCTCTTIGMVAAAAGAIRIDAPMMQAAANTGGCVLMAYCLNSTLDPSTDMLQTAMDKAANTAGIEPLFLGEFWPLFEAGETEAFAACIAGAVRHRCTDRGGVTAVVLAQGSMAAAAPLLADLGVPVFASVELALRAALAACAA